jgi:protein-disulfide isomerase
MARTHRHKKSSGHQRIPTAHVLVVTVLAFLAAGMMILLDSDILRSCEPASDCQSYETGITSNGQPYKGALDAPLQMEVFSDFVCSHCGGLTDSLHALSPDYIETGKLRVVFRNFAFLTPESIQAAIASECALEQGADKFWQYHDVLYSNRTRGLSAFSNDQLKRYAREIGLDMTLFSVCLDSEATLDEVQADQQEGTERGVTGTPNWFINGEFLQGGYPEDILRQIFDELLAR